MNTRCRINNLDRSTADNLAVVVNCNEFTQESPHVVAIGKSEVAVEIRRLAIRYGIPVAEEEDLAIRLSKLEVPVALPSSFFPEVAKLFARYYS